jgi:heme exporter protein C
MKELASIAWWKWACAGLLIYTVVGGLLLEVPRLPILNESIRNLYFHVPMWFGMIILLAVSAVYSIRTLLKYNPLDDLKAQNSVHVALLLGILGIVTGMLWAKYTWGAYWSNDPKQNAAAIGLLIYFAYMILRGSFADEQLRARISAVYNVLAFALFIPLIFILPRLTDSLHPGNGGNPGFNSYDLDARMRLVFYPAVIAWTLIGWWLVDLMNRVHVLNNEEVEA